MNRLLWKAGLLLLTMCAAAAISAEAQTLTILFSFSGATGINPLAPLVQGTDGNLYGTAFIGGQGGGTVFRISPKGTPSVIHNFHGPDGSMPTGLVLETNGNLYGTTATGGANSCSTNTGGCGTVFGFTSKGTLFTLHSFNGLDGNDPAGGLTLGPDASFYGTTQESTSNSCQCGTIFKITFNGSFTLLHTFTGGGDGSRPFGAPLALGRDGNFYGTTTEGGPLGFGTVFMINPEGTTYRILHSFSSTDGSVPTGALVQDAKGFFYGTTQLGGRFGRGTIFLISPSGLTFRVLHNFSGGQDGGEPTAGLVLGADGNFYGATSIGGNASDGGTLFQITPKSVLTTLANFNGVVGNLSINTLMQATNGTFYGTTSEEGSQNAGTAFSLSTGLGPFITTVPPLRGIGAKVLILGQGFTGATSVTFNGIPAQFTVNSDTEIITSVPVGAKTGYVKVTTPGGILSTKVVFVVG